MFINSSGIMQMPLFMSSSGISVCKYSKQALIPFNRQLSIKQRYYLHWNVIIKQILTLIYQPECIVIENSLLCCFLLSALYHPDRELSILLYLAARSSTQLISIKTVPANLCKSTMHCTHTSTLSTLELIASSASTFFLSV